MRGRAPIRVLARGTFNNDATKVSLESGAGEASKCRANDKKDGERTRSSRRDGKMVFKSSKDPGAADGQENCVRTTAVIPSWA